MPTISDSRQAAARMTAVPSKLSPRVTDLRQRLSARQAVQADLAEALVVQAQLSLGDSVDGKRLKCKRPTETTDHETNLQPQRL